MGVRDLNDDRLASPASLHIMYRWHRPDGTMRQRCIPRSSPAAPLPRQLPPSAHSHLKLLCHVHCCPRTTLRRPKGERGLVDKRQSDIPACTLVPRRRGQIAHATGATRPVLRPCTSHRGLFLRRGLLSLATHCCTSEAHDKTAFSEHRWTAHRCRHVDMPTANTPAASHTYITIPTAHCCPVLIVRASMRR